MLSLLCFTFVDETLSYIEVSLNEEISSSHTHTHSLELLLKSLEHKIYVLHSCNVVYPWAFAGDHKPLCEQLPKIGPYRPCLYTCELFFYLLHSISLFYLYHTLNLVKIEFLELLLLLCLSNNGQ